MPHARDDQADAAPGVEPLAHQSQLGRVVAHEDGGDRSAEAPAPGVQFLRSGHSITWSARASSDGGMVSPSALAVFRLITNWNLEGCCTGRSPGRAPLRIRST